MADRKLVSTRVVKCRKCEFDDEERYVRIILYEGGVIEVRCTGGCSKCKYRPRVDIGREGQDAG